MPTRYIDATHEAGKALFMRGIQGEITMLNLLRFREEADYTKHPELAPDAPISGREAYRRYIEHTLPFLSESGGSLHFAGEGGPFLIGPPDECWDLAMLVRHRSLQTFMAFATDEAYLAGAGHRAAALEDSRLLPLVEQPADALLKALANG